jgi:hypothetical protein
VAPPGPVDRSSATIAELQGRFRLTAGNSRYVMLGVDVEKYVKFKGIRIVEEEPGAAAGSGRRPLRCCRRGRKDPMSLPQSKRLDVVLVAVAVLAAPLVALPAGSAGATEPGQTLLAPFACGSEWSGTTYPGHGENDWNLDLNRTSLVWPDDGHDLGQPILAQGVGTVVWLEQAGYNSGAGAYLEVDYGDTTVRYIHLVEQSIPAEVAEIGSPVTTGQLIGMLGGTGNASHPHLHLEYWDSVGAQDAPRWELPAGNQIKISMNGVEIDPGDVFVSTNCNGPTPIPIPTPFPFADVSTESFAYHDIALLAHLDITTGTTPTTFAPDVAVTRDQMAAFLIRLWTLLDGGATTLPVPLIQPFSDVDELSFAYDDIAMLAYLELSTGTTPATFDPDGNVTREQMAAFLARLYRLLAPPDRETLSW